MVCTAVDSLRRERDASPTCLRPAGVRSSYLARRLLWTLPMSPASAPGVPVCGALDTAIPAGLGEVGERFVGSVPRFPSRALARGSGSLESAGPECPAEGRRVTRDPLSLLQVYASRFSCRSARAARGAATGPTQIASPDPRTLDRHCLRMLFRAFSIAPRNPHFAG